jgi:hypothetical protein
MSALGTIVVIAFVLVVLGVVGYWLFELAFGRHSEQFRDPQSGSRRGESPHLEMRDEYERTHDTGSPHLETRDEFEHKGVGVA